MGRGRAAWSGQNRGVRGVHTVRQFSRTDSLTGEARVCGVTGLSCKALGLRMAREDGSAFCSLRARCSGGENWRISAWFGSRQEE